MATILNKSVGELVKGDKVVLHADLWEVAAIAPYHHQPYIALVMLPLTGATLYYPNMVRPDILAVIHSDEAGELPDALYLVETYRSTHRIAVLVD